MVILSQNVVDKSLFVILEKIIKYIHIFIYHTWTQFLNRIKKFIYFYIGQTGVCVFQS